MSIFFKKFKVSVLVLSLLSVQTIFAASDDDYLKQLEMEVDDNISEVPAANTQQSKRSSGSNSDSMTLDAPSSSTELILDKKELIVDETSFEKALQGTYPESYALYQQLTDSEKKQVYKKFTQSKRLYNSSLKIISIYLASH